MTGESVIRYQRIVNRNPGIRSTVFDSRITDNGFRHTKAVVTRGACQLPASGGLPAFPLPKVKVTEAARDKRGYRVDFPADHQPRGYCTIIFLTASTNSEYLSAFVT